MDINGRIRERWLQWYWHIGGEAEEGVLIMVEGMDVPGRRPLGRLRKNKDSAAGLHRRWELGKRWP